MSRYDNIFNDMSNINVTNRMQGSGYTNTVKNFGYNTDADKRVNLNKKVEDDYKPESMKPFSHMTSYNGYENSDTQSNLQATQYESYERQLKTRNYYNEDITEEAYDKLRNPESSKGSYYKGNFSTSVNNNLMELVKYPVKGTEVYQGYEYSKRTINIVTMLATAPLAAAELKISNRHYDSSALNDALVKNGYHEIIRDSNISNREFIQNMEKAFTADGNTQWKQIAARGGFSGKEFDHIEFGGLKDRNLKNGQIIAITKDNKKYTINTKDLIIATKDGNITGKGYMDKFLTDRASREANIVRNVRDINSYLKSDSVFGSLGVHNMNSNDIISRLKFNTDGTAIFKSAFGKNQTLTVQQARILQDVAHHKGLSEASSRKNGAKGKRRKAFKREAENLIKDNELYEGYAKTSKFLQIASKVRKAPSMLVNSRINHRRKKFENKAAKGKLGSFGQKRYDMFYGNKGIFTYAQKDIGQEIKNKVAPIKNETKKKVKQAGKTVANKTVGKAGRTVKNSAKKGVGYLRGKSTKLDRFMSFSERLKNKFQGKYNTLKEKSKNRRRNKKHKKGNNLFKRAITKVCIIIAAIVLIPTILVSVIPIVVPMITATAVSGLQEAMKMEEAQSKATASTKEIYDYMHQEYPSMSVADILGIMSLMKYQSDLNAFYMKDDEVNEMGLLCFNQQEQEAINDICLEKGWGDPFSISYAGEDDNYNGDDEGAWEIDMYKLRESRQAQIKYICTLINDENYPSVSEVSTETMASQAMAFAQNVRGMDLDDVQKADIQQAAIDMYYEYVMWEIEFLKPTDDSWGSTLINAALFPYARTYAGEHMDMSKLYPGTVLGSYRTGWSNWFVKYVFAQTDIADEIGCYYLTTNLNDIETLVEKADENGFWHSYEEVANTDDSEGIKPGYLVVVKNSDDSYSVGIVINVQYSWNDSTSSSDSTFTVLMGDDYGTNYVYNKDSEVITNVNAKQTGSSDDTTLRMSVYSMNDYRCDNDSSFDQYANIIGFVAWYDPVTSMVNHDWENSQQPPEPEPEPPDSLLSDPLDDFFFPIIIHRPLIE